MTVIEALDKARELDLDLIEMDPSADPATFQILDYGKAKYEDALERRRKGHDQQ